MHHTNRRQFHKKAREVVKRLSRLIQSPEVAGAPPGISENLIDQMSAEERTAVIEFGQGLMRLFENRKYLQVDESVETAIVPNESVAAGHATRQSEQADRESSTEGCDNFLSQESSDR